MLFALGYFCVFKIAYSLATFSIQSVSQPLPAAPLVLLRAFVTFEPALEGFLLPSAQVGVAAPVPGKLKLLLPSSMWNHENSLIAWHNSTYQVDEPFLHVHCHYESIEVRLNVKPNGLDGQSIIHNCTLTTPTMGNKMKSEMKNVERVRGGGQGQEKEAGRDRASKMLGNNLASFRLRCVHDLRLGRLHKMTLSMVTCPTVPHPLTPPPCLVMLCAIEHTDTYVCMYEWERRRHSQQLSHNFFCGYTL